MKTTRCSATLAKPEHRQVRGPKADFGGFGVNFGPRDHVASHCVDLSMLTADGKVRR